MGAVNASDNSDEEISFLPQPRTFMPGVIIYVEKCRLFHDEQDINLPWTPSRHSLLQPPPSISTASKITLPSNHEYKEEVVDMGDSVDPFVHGNYAYTPRWASREEFQEILISTTMLKDHSPFSIFEALNKVPEDRKLRVLDH